LSVDDGQHDTADAPRLLELARAEPSALISGAPLYDASAPAARRYGRLITAFWVALETASFQLRDTMCGFRVYPLAPTLAVLDCHPPGLRMDFDIEIMVRLYWARVPVRFVPTRVTYPAGGTSHFHPFRDNLRISWMHTRLCLAAPWNLLRRIFRSAPPPAAPPAVPLPAHWSSRRERAGGFFGVRLLFSIHRLLGRRAFLALLFPVIAVFYAAGGNARRASRDYLRRLKERAGTLGIALPVPPAKLTPLRHFLRFGDALHEKLAAWRGEIPAGDVEICTTPEVRERILERGRTGVILLSHLGNHELCRAFGAGEGRVVNAVVFTKHAGNFNKLLRELAPDSQLNLISTTDFGPATAVALQEKIAAGEWVAIAADRTSPATPERNVNAQFLGADAPFPQGPFLLAAALKVPVLFMVGIREPNAGLKIHIELFADPLEIRRTNRPADLAAAAARYAVLLERYALRAPLDWFNFFEFWAPAN